jgi:hypothetical protein
MPWMSCGNRWQRCGGDTATPGEAHHAKELGQPLGLDWGNFLSSQDRDLVSGMQQIKGKHFKPVRYPTIKKKYQYQYLLFLLLHFHACWGLHSNKGLFSQNQKSLA